MDLGSKLLREAGEVGSERSEVSRAKAQLLDAMFDAASADADTEPTQRVGAPPLREASPALAGDELEDRYAVLAPLGSGGMGVVLRAYDQRLRREVALKTVRLDVLASDAEARLLREAQAMAQLSHPNVVAIHDVVANESQLCLVMELVEGETLGTWLATSRSTREVLRVFTDAGRGLAAAHAVGLVHRDFKPANVLVARGGAVKVTDFGLAKPMAGADALDESSEHGHPTSRGRSTFGAGDSGQITRRDAVIGTPRYMAPEQHNGSEADARSDQYALCAALWEALAGAPPFAASETRALARAKLEGPPDARFPRGVPRRVIRALRRGLNPSPRLRYESVPALLADLRPRSSVPLIGVGAVAAISIGAAGAWSSTDSCDGVEDEIEEVWNAERSGNVRRSLEGRGPAFVSNMWSRTETRLDDWVLGWKDERARVCAEAARRETTEQAAELRVACLARARTALDRSLALAAREDVEPQAVAKIFSRLPDTARCTDVAELRAALPEDPELASRVREVRTVLEDARQRAIAGLLEEADALVEEATAEGEVLGDARVQSKIHETQAAIALRRADYDTALEQTREATAWGMRAGSGPLVVDGLLLAAWLLAEAQRDIPAGREAARLALAGAQRLEGDAFLSAAEYAVGLVEFHAADYTEAEHHLRRALATADRADPRYGDRQQILSTLANTLQRQGKADEAVEISARAISELSARVGDRHPGVVSQKISHSVALRFAGRRDDSVEVLREALDAAQEGLVPDHPLIAYACLNLGNIQADIDGASDETEALVRRALGIWEKVHGPDHPDVAMALNNLGNQLVNRGRAEEAIAPLERSLKIRETVLGKDHPDVAHPLKNLARALHYSGRDAEGLPHAERALALWSESLGPEHKNLTAVLIALADLHIGLGHHDKARAYAERAMALAQRPPVTPNNVGAAQLRLDELDALPQ